MKRISAFLAAALSVAMLFAACGGEASLAGENAASKGSPKPIEGDVVVGLIFKNTVDAFQATMNNRARDRLEAYKKAGVIKDWQRYDPQTDASTQVSQLEDAISNGCNFIMFMPVDASGSDPIVTRCAELGIPCVPINSYTKSSREFATAYSGSDDVQAGEMMAEYVMKKVPGGGKYVHMMGVVGSSAQMDRGAGVAKHMNESSGWKCMAYYPGEWLAEKAVNFATDAITQYDDELKAIVCDNDDMSSAVQAYCNSIGREDIVCIGVDGNAGPLQMIKLGTLGATVFQDGVAQVDYAMDLIPYIIKGDNKTMNWWNDTIPFVMITSENVEKYL